MDDSFDRKKYINSEISIKKDLCEFLDPNGHNIIFDIGGCEGEDSVRYSRLFPDSTIYVFEPLPINQERIKRNLSDYSLKNVFLEPIALSDISGISEFYVSSGQPEIYKADMDWDFGNKSSSLLKPEQTLNTHKWLKFNEVMQVQTSTIDEFVIKKNISEIDFIHLDVQGAELKVLEGAKVNIGRIKIIWLEIAEFFLYKQQPLKKEVEKFMKKNGFKLIKTQMEGKVGDQLYINKRHFKLKRVGVKFFWRVSK